MRAVREERRQNLKSAVVVSFVEMRFSAVLKAREDLM